MVRAADTHATQRRVSPRLTDSDEPWSSGLLRTYLVNNGVLPGDENGGSTIQDTGAISGQEPDGNVEEPTPASDSPLGNMKFFWLYLVVGCAAAAAIAVVVAAFVVRVRRKQNSNRVYAMDASTLPRVACGCVHVLRYTSPDMQCRDRFFERLLPHSSPSRARRAARRLG